MIFPRLTVFLVNRPIGRIGIGLYRVLHSNPEHDAIWLIPVPNFNAPVPEGKRRRRTYVKGVEKTSLDAFSDAKRDHHVAAVPFKPPSIWGKPDDEIKRAWYVNNPLAGARDIEIRDRRWSWIEEFVEKTQIEDILELNLIRAFVKRRSQDLGVSKVALYAALHLYLASGFAKNALLGGTTRCGGKGKERRFKKKPGRRNVAALSGDDTHAGFVKTKDAVEQAQYAWPLVKKHGREGAYLIYSGAFFSEVIVAEDGATSTRLLPAHMRPTPRQFETWGLLGEGNEPARRLKLSKLEWDKRLPGAGETARARIAMVGQLAPCDTSSNDDYLVRTDSRIKVCGFVNRLFIYDGRSTAIAGLHAGYESPSAMTFLLAVLNAADDKVEFCARYGHKIRPDQWFTYVARCYGGDNGEYNCELVRQALSQFGAHVRYIPVGRADLNPLAEAGHHTIHARSDHHLDGTTRGRMRQRGEPHPALFACLNFHEYMHELIGSVLKYNNEQDISSQLTVEQRSALSPSGEKVSRVMLHRWLVDSGYVATTVPDIELLRAHCMPRLRAVVRENGIFLLREDTGKRKAVVNQLRFMAPYLHESGLLKRAKFSGAFEVQVHGNRSQPDAVWLCTERDGLQRLKNVSDDPIVVMEATVRDCELMQDDSKRATFDRLGTDQQAALDEIEDRAARLGRSRMAKQSEIDALPKPPSKSSQTRGIAQNRKDEIDFLRRQAGTVSEAKGAPRPTPEVATGVEADWDSDVAARAALLKAEAEEAAEATIHESN